MQLPTDILTPSQRNALHQFENLLATDHRHAQFVSPRQNGTTHMLLYLSHLRGLGATATEFLYIDVRNRLDQWLANQRGPLIGRADQHRTILLVDEPLDDATSDHLDEVLPTGSLTVSTSMLEDQQRESTVSMPPATPSQIRTFCDAQQLTLRGQKIQITDLAVEALHSTTRGITGAIVASLAEAIEVASSIGTTKIDSQIIEACHLASTPSHRQAG